MKERSIIMSAEEVRAILDGRKTRIKQSAQSAEPSSDQPS